MNNPMNNLGMHKLTIAVAVITLAAGLGAGYWLAGRQAPETAAEAPAGEGRKILFYRNPMNPAITSPVPAKDEMGMDYIPVYAEEDKPKERKILFYRNPMNPSVTSPVPAKDEMGMDYIPVYADEEGGADEPAGTVKIDPVTVQNIGVRTAVAEKRTMGRAVRAVGRVDFDETRLSRLHPKIAGWVEKLYVSKTGQRVKKDTILLSIYSPQLVTSQQEYLLALNNMETLEDSSFQDIRKGAEELLKSARERLELLDIPEHQIRELEETREVKKSLHIHSPFSGVVMKVGVREGQHVNPKTLLYMLADLSRVWVYVDVYEYELPWIKLGDEAEIRLQGVPGRPFKGRVSYIYPYAEAKTRTIRVRLEFANPKGLLRPDMFTDVTIKASRQVDAVVIPAEAVVRSGTREQVFVVRGPGKFEPREVALGVTSDGYTQVLKGVSEGEQVVTSAQFLIDSESKLREATAKMLEAAKAGKTESAPGGMNMDHDKSGGGSKAMDHGSKAMDHKTKDQTMDHKGMDHGAHEGGKGTKAAPMDHGAMDMQGAGKAGGGKTMQHGDSAPASQQGGGK